MQIWIYKAVGVNGDVLCQSSTLAGLEYYMNQGMNWDKQYRVVKEKVK